MKKRSKKKKKEIDFTHNFCVHNPANWRWILGSCEQLPVSRNQSNDIVTRENKSRTRESGRRRGIEVAGKEPSRKARSNNIYLPRWRALRCVQVQRN